ncbi:MAG: hypothetical protein HY922_09150 [Elusimicrobia bacterium]|nr:hypothetical protein [Elusimicrobiota bacterium]
MKRRTCSILAACACLTFIFLWEQVQATRLGYEVGRSQKLLQRQAQMNAYLRMELARLSAPDRLAREAQSRLKMIPPDPQSQIFLGESSGDSEARAFKASHPNGQTGTLSFLFRR